MQFTIGQSARETGKSKSTISKAVKNGTISAEKQPDGSYQIDAAELFRVFPRKAEEPVAAPHEQTAANTVLLLENRELKARLEMQDKLVRALEADKSFLQEQLHRTTLLLTSAKEPHEPVSASQLSDKRSWWQRWFR
jgi:hypothetical protein